MNETRHVVCVCPVCGANNDAATDVIDQATPADGDLSICVSCANPAIFCTDSEGTVTGMREPDAEERALIEADPRINRVRAAITLFHGMEF